MKKLSILLVGLLVISGLATAQQQIGNLSISGTATLEWGFQGQLLDTSTGAWGVAAADRTGTQFAKPLMFDSTSGSSSSVKANAAPKFRLTLSVKDENDLVIVKAQTTEVTVAYGSVANEGTVAFPFDYIEFPNVVPGILGVGLKSVGALETDVTVATSLSSDESVYLDIYPMGKGDTQLMVKVGVLPDLGNPLNKEMADGNDLTYDYYTTFATSAYAEFKLGLTAKDSVTVGVGTIFDTAWSSAIVTGTDAVATETLGSLVVMDNPVEDWEAWGNLTLPIGFKANLVMMDGLLKANANAQVRLAEGKDEDNLATDGTFRAWEMPLYADFDVSYTLKLGEDKAAASAYTQAQAVVSEAMTAWVTASRAVGAQQADIDASMLMKAQADVVEAQEALAVAQAGLAAAEAVDADSDAAADAAEAVADAEEDLADAQAAADTAALQGGVADLVSAAGAAETAYNQAVARAAAFPNVVPIEVVPTANFKYSNDFWKWGYNVANTAFIYGGEVKAAEFIGRPMSAGVGVSVKNIAGLVDVSLSGAMGFGDGEYAHGPFVLVDATGAAADAVTLANYLTGSKLIAGDPVDDVNDGSLKIADTNVLKGTLGLTARPMDNLTVTNTFGYTHDGLGLLGAGTVAVIQPFGRYMDQITNDLTARYTWKIAGTTAFTLGANLNYKSVFTPVEFGTTYNLTDGTATASELTSVSTLGYKIFLATTVGF